MTTNRVEHVYNLIVFAVRTARREARIPDLDAIVAKLRDELQRDVRAGRFSEQEAREMDEVITIAFCRVKQQGAI